MGDAQCRLPPEEQGRSQSRTEEGSMFRRNHHTPPSQVFSHADGCKIVKADPNVQIPWSEIESGHWRATCQCGSQHYHEPGWQTCSG